MTPIAEDSSPPSQHVPVYDHPVFTARPGSPDSQPIEYRYLNFESDIPLVPVIPPGVKGEIPSCPNLRKYDNPFAWPRTRKYLLTCLSCSVNITAAYSAGAYAAPAFELTEKWGVSEVAYNVGISLYTYGFGVAPMVLAPFSEINGRRPMFIITGILFVSKSRVRVHVSVETDFVRSVCQICCALTSSYGGMLASRFFLGVGGCG